MKDAEATLGRSSRDQIVGGRESTTPAQLPRRAERCGTYRGRDRRLRQRGERPVERLKAVLVACAGQDLECRDGQTAMSPAASVAWPRDSRVRFGGSGGISLLPLRIAKAWR